MPAPNGLSLYALYRKDRYLRQVTDDNKNLYLMLQEDPGVSAPVYTLYQLTLPAVLYTVEYFADVLQNTLRTVVTNATVAWQEASKTYAINYSATGLAATGGSPTPWTWTRP